MRQFLLVIMIFTALLLSGCSGKEATLADKYKGQSAQQIFHKGEVYLAKGRYKDAVTQFEALDTLYPFSTYEHQAQVNIIYAYYKSDDFASAAAAASRYIHLYPRSKDIDYAYYMRGMAHFSQNRGFSGRYLKIDFSERDLTNMKQAYNDFYDMIERFPSSRYVPNARARMVYLRNMMANYELNVARFYYKKAAYLAAINRCDNILQRYQQAPAVVPALGIIVDSYDRLKLYPLADKALSVLTYNYPNSDVYKHIMQTRAKHHA